MSANTTDTPQSPEGPRVEVGQVRRDKIWSLGDYTIEERTPSGHWRVRWHRSGNRVTYPENVLDSDPLVSPAPHPAAPRVGPATTVELGQQRRKPNGCEYVVTERLGDDHWRIRYSDGGGSFPWSTAELHRDAIVPPAPASPTGTPANVENPRCVSCDQVWTPVQPDLVRGVCEPCLTATMVERDTEARERRRIEAIKERWQSEPWSPAIESLGGVRPFGRPRGMR